MCEECERLSALYADLIQDEELLSRYLQAVAEDDYAAIEQLDKAITCEEQVRDRRRLDLETHQATHTDQVRAAG